MWVHIGVWPCVHSGLHTLLLHMTSVKVLSHIFCTQMNIIWVHTYVKFIFHLNQPFLYTKYRLTLMEVLALHQGGNWVKIPGGHHGWVRTYWANSEWKKYLSGGGNKGSLSLSIYKHKYYNIIYNTNILPLITVKWINNWLWSKSSESFDLCLWEWLSKRE